jgi:1-acyl-sn-glycerol-3-phosphate acyltransferase
MPLIWLVCFVLTRGGRLRIRKKGMRGLRPPFLVVATHHAFMDFYVTPLTLFPFRANYISELEGFEHYGEWIYRQIGCLGTRKFVSDLALIRNIRRVTARGDILVVYPEARYANVGTHSPLSLPLVKLARLLDVPVVTLNMHGNYLRSPIWNLRTRRGIRLEAEIEQVFSREELQAADDEEVLRVLQEKLSYDEYAMQWERGIEITEPWRAEGLEAVLYLCPECGAEFRMRAEGAQLRCEACGLSMWLTPLGRLEVMAPAACCGQTFHIPALYEAQRAKVEAEVASGAYRLCCEVFAEALPNAKNFVDCGIGTLWHDAEGFRLKLGAGGVDGGSLLHFPPASMESVHTEYDFRGRGQCITLSTPDNTWFLYPVPEAEWFNVTKIQFAQECLYRSARGVLQE